MRRNLIILGAVAALAVATLTVNARDRTPEAAGGTLASLVTARTHIVPLDRDDVAIAVRSVVASPASVAAAKPAVVTQPAAAKLALSSACQTAINNLKALHQADVAEDAAERNTDRSAAALAAERAEDAAEVQHWTSALTAARSACVPQRTAACQTAITNLQAILQSWRNADLGDLRLRIPSDWSARLASVRTAFTAVGTACSARA